MNEIKSSTNSRKDSTNNVVDYVSEAEIISLLSSCHYGVPPESISNFSDDLWQKFKTIVSVEMNSSECNRSVHPDVSGRAVYIAVKRITNVHNRLFRLLCVNNFDLSGYLRDLHNKNEAMEAAIRQLEFENREPQEVSRVIGDIDRKTSILYYELSRPIHQEYSALYEKNKTEFEANKMNEK